MLARGVLCPIRLNLVTQSRYRRECQWHARRRDDPEYQPGQRKRVQRQGCGSCMEWVATGVRWVAWTFWDHRSQDV